MQFTDAPDWRHSIEAYQAGDLQRAFDLIAKVPDTVTDRRFLSYRAALLLSVGRVDKAHGDIGRILRQKPDDDHALALQTIIEIVQNREGAALKIAQKAAQASPNSPSVLMALSYAQQAVFDLEGAKKTVEKITALDPQNALAWARLSELQASFGELDEALKSARKGFELKPGLSRTLTVLGFSQLMRIDTRKATESFKKAIASAPSDPLPRLGLGLAKIRKGDLQEGRRVLEIAAGLDPNNAIVRSYLGKAYYEEKRKDLSDREFETAEELDPNDPTPYFYDAIEKQTTNRPVEALHSVQKAAELNDNRAVYRSRLLLDSDDAARTASVGRIYSDLGFQELALRSGWKSSITDPTNFSAHRLLADSYSILPRHEIARVSELLQSQLLQPLNMTPIQPQMAFSNLFLVSAGGPGSMSFNEFNPIFNRNGFTFQGSGLVAENETYAGEGVIAGIQDHFAYSVGGYHYQTDGWRNNSDQADYIGDAFFQYDLSPKTSIQAEYRYRQVNWGDLQSKFFSDDYFQGLSNDEERNIFRLGGRHSFSPDSIVLASYVYQHAVTGTNDNRFPLQPIAGFPLDSTFLIPSEEDAHTVELQHLFRSRYVNLTSGASYAGINGQIGAFLTVPPPVGPLTLLNLNLDEDHEVYTVYSYAYLKLLSNLTVTLGGSGYFVHGSPDVIADNGEIYQFNPKGGITWQPFSGTTVRAAWFRNLKRTLVTNQTLEPTQVAGFNQFFDDQNATDSWRYGAGIDQKFTQDLFGGVELSHRDVNLYDITVDSDGVAPPATTGRTSDEDQIRTYLFWTPHDWLALRAEYNFDRFEFNETGHPPQDPLKLNTHSLPLGVSFFHPSGLSTAVTATYWNQSGKFQRALTGEQQSGSDEFWTVDAALNYRLPKRYGFLSVGARNLLDRKFNYYEIDKNNAHLIPDRMAFFKVTLAVP
ncbi:tetratricopeptide repeat protein [Methylosarcina fibrata]|uniref:tetratricopeptide repeat protein n=1 Tax=Methylosarcina fibrata TaxID=105972 RepID=UPI00036C514D|nr:tetratricopeptide repeat protein [Methylosarcina fibrata]